MEYIEIRFSSSAREKYVNLILVSLYVSWFGIPDLFCCNSEFENGRLSFLLSLIKNFYHKAKNGTIYFHCDTLNIN